MKTQREEVFRKVGMIMSVLMSLTLTVVGLLSAGHFTIPGFLISFVVGLVISFLIRKHISISNILADFYKKSKIKPNSLKGNIIEAIIIDLLHSPLICTINICFAYFNATSHGARISFLPMWSKALLMSILCSFIMTLIMKPIVIKLVMKDDNDERH